MSAERRGIVALIALLVAGSSVLAQPAPAHAYVYLYSCFGAPAVWRDSVIPFHRNSCSVPDGHPMIPAIQDAFASYAQVIRWPRMEIAEVEPETSCTTLHGDGVSEIGITTHAQLGANGRAFGFVGDLCLPGGTQAMVETDILIAADADVDFTPPDERSPTDRVPASFVVMHELGHAMNLADLHGVGHLAVMRTGPPGVYVGGTGSNIALYPDDAAGLRTLVGTHSFVNLMASSQLFLGSPQQRVPNPLDERYVCHGEAIEVGFTVLEQGNLHSGGADIEIFLHHDPRPAGYARAGRRVMDGGRISLPIFPPDGIRSARYTVRVPQSVPPGEYHLFMEVDPDGRLTERSELDNVVQSPVDVHVRECRNDWPGLTVAGFASIRPHDQAAASELLAVRPDPAISGALHAFAIRYPENRVHHAWQDGTADWSDWRPLPEGAMREIVAHEEGGRLALYGIADDGTLQVTRSTGGPDEWSAWERLADQPLSQLAVASNNDGYPEVFGVAPDGRLFHMARYRITAGAAAGVHWSEPTPISALGFVTRTFAVGNESDGRVTVIADQGAAGLRRLRHSSASAFEIFGVRRFGYGSWDPVPLPAPGAGARQLVIGRTADAAGRELALFMVDSDGEVWRNRRTLVVRRPGRFPIFDEAWSGWSRAGLPPGVQQIAVGNHAEGGPGRGRLFLVGLTGRRAWRSSQRATSPFYDWVAPSDMGPFRPGGFLTVASNPDGRLEAFVVDAGRSLRHDWEDPSRWNGWYL